MIKTLAMASILFTSISTTAQHLPSDANAADETGQSAFAAIAEIVGRLREDENTDWLKVDIDALRAHLVDMNNVTTLSKVDGRTTPSGMSFLVTGEGDVIGSIQRMVNGHAPMLESEMGWEVTVETQDRGATLTIAVGDVENVMVKALGFYGIMTIGAHHQAHHLMIARGHNPH